MENNDKSLGAMFSIFNKLSIQQRMMIGGIFGAMIVMLSIVFMTMSEPSYTVLYSNISSEDATKVIDYLSGQKIPYKLDAGQTISVPENQIYEVRIALAGRGIPSSGFIGYEVFDKNTMGMSEFMQKLNFKRALEGEIAKTIVQMRGIEHARVNIVFPEKSIFKQEQEDPTASVALKTSRLISENNINAITHLVSSSVEGLSPEKVTIVDSQGRLLTKQFEENTIDAVNGKQYEIKGEVESYLSGKAQAILDKVVGYGNSSVKVNIELDFTQIEKENTTFDPDGQVAVSEQSVKSENTGVSSVDSSLVTSENSLTNYELSKSIERVIQGSGGIKRITVAVVINGVEKTTQAQDGTTQTTVEPRSQEQIDQLTLVISQAVGIDNNRNDQISIVSIPFDSQLTEEPVIEESPIGNMDELIKLVMMAVGALAAMLVIKQLMTKLKNEKIMIGTFSGEGFSEEAFGDLLPQGADGMTSLPSSMQQKINKKRREMIEIGDIEDEISDEAVMKKLEQEKIVNYVQKNPQEAAKLINSWLREDEY